MSGRHGFTPPRRHGFGTWRHYPCGAGVGLSERTIRRGIQELQAGNLGEMPERSAVLAGDGNRAKRSIRLWWSDLELLMGETTAGDPMRLLKWTTKSLRSIAKELSQRGHPVSHPTVHRLLRELDYSLWGNQRSIEGKQHPQRDAQFRYLYQQVKRCMRAKIPVISVDTKKKELVGAFHNKGRRWGKNQHWSILTTFRPWPRGGLIPMAFTTKPRTKAL